MKIIRNDPQTTLDYLDCGDTFSISIDGFDIYIKTCYVDEDDDILCVNLETGNYRFLRGSDEVFPVRCSVSVEV